MDAWLHIVSSTLTLMSARLDHLLSSACMIIVAICSELITSSSRVGPSAHLFETAVRRFFDVSTITRGLRNNMSVREASRASIHTSWDRCVHEVQILNRSSEIALVRWWRIAFCPGAVFPPTTNRPNNSFLTPTHHFPVLLKLNGVGDKVLVWNLRNVVATSQVMVDILCGVLITRLEIGSTTTNEEIWNH